MKGSCNEDGSMYARVCVEVDVSSALPSQVWIRTSKEDGYWQKVEYEGNINYCTVCGLLGHEKSVCRKKIFKQQSNPSPDRDANEDIVIGDKPRSIQKGNEVNMTIAQIAKNPAVHLVPTAKKGRWTSVKKNMHDRASGSKSKELIALEASPKENGTVTLSHNKETRHMEPDVRAMVNVDDNEGKQDIEVKDKGKGI